MRGDVESVKMQVRHVHAGIHRARLGRLGRKFIDVCDFENVTWRRADDRRDGLAVESKSILPVFIDRVKRDGYHMILRANLWRLRQRNALRAGERRERNYAKEDWQL